MNVERVNAILKTVIFFKFFPFVFGIVLKLLLQFTIVVNRRQCAIWDYY